MVRICFVCLGNICRSPTAEGVLRHYLQQEQLSDRVTVDSAGTGAWHAGESPDRRASSAAKRRGIHLGGAARQFVADDFERFDYVLAMDSENLANLRALAPSQGALERLHLFRDFDGGDERGQSVPDPYYGGDGGFDHVLDICEAACRGLLDHLRREGKI